MTRKWLSLPGLLLATAMALGSFGCAAEYYDGDGQGEMLVESEPPPPQEEVRPAVPYEGAVWVEGYWHWNGARYLWFPGRWERPRAGYLWVPHHWIRAGAHWHYSPGPWHRL